MPEKTRPSPGAAAGAPRRRILDHLKLGGAADAGSIAAAVGTTAMAVRQHLYQLRDEGLVSYREEARAVGRPAKLWELTARADAHFPDAHAALAVDLIGALEETFGRGGMERLIAHRTAEQVENYRARVPARASLRSKLERLAAVRTEEGYLAEVEEEGRGSWLLVENHCPICAAATACTGLCRSELEVFQTVLGERVRVERTEHLMEGARRCAYRVSRA